MKKTWRIAAINFDHMHMGDLLRMAHEHPQVDIVGICDEDRSRMQEAIKNFEIPRERVFTDYRQCMEQTKPDLVILCPATGEHAEWTKRVAPYGAHVFVEKPFAASLEQADEMIAALRATGKELIINWPLCWVESHVTAKRLIDQGLIGKVKQVRHYGGNRGPLWHGADKVVTEPTAERKAKSWFYKKAAGGGSLLDYLGYGTTLGTWYMGGKAPIEVTAVVDAPEGLEVDEQSLVVARYDTGLSKFETRWGTFTDPWVHQPQPKCGFVIIGDKGTISSYDYEKTVRVQTVERPEAHDLPVIPLEAPHKNPIQHVLHCLETGEPMIGPLTPRISRIGQQIVDSALKSAKEKRTVKLVE